MAVAATASTITCRARRLLRDSISAYPSLFLPLAKRRYPHKESRVVTRDTQLVIEGFPRSANTFAVEAFELAQPAPIRIVHHLHAPAQIIAAARMGIPTIALIREPHDAITSYLIRETCVTPRIGLAEYIRFYRSVSRCRRSVVVADFDTVTTDFGSVIRRTNRRFGTAFAEFEHSEENVQKLFRVIEEGNRETYGSVVESTISRPSAHRGEIKRAVGEEYRAQSLAGLRRKAESLYAALVVEAAP